MEFDVIGDVHGHHAELVALILDLGYQKKAGAFRHPEPSRTAVFLGDLMDRGPGQIETLDLVRRMVDRGSAQTVMGNHEHGAIGWLMRDPLRPERTLREHSAKNRGQHEAFLAAVGEGSDLHHEWVAWMRRMPIYLDLPGIRCIHACWHPKHVAIVDRYSTADAVLTDEGVLASFDRRHQLGTTVDILIRGPEVDLPDGFGFNDHGGQFRTKSRVRWWDADALCLSSGAITDGAAIPGLPVVPLGEDALVEDEDTRPVFFGHYWFQGEPELVSPRRVCLDYSVARPGGVLCAYTWRGEPELDPANLVWLSRDGHLLHP